MILCSYGADKFAFSKKSQQLLILVSNFREMQKGKFLFQSYPSFLSYLYSYFSILTSNFRDIPENENFRFNRDHQTFLSYLLRIAS